MEMKHMLLTRGHSSLLSHQNRAVEAPESQECEDLRMTPRAAVDSLRVLSSNP